MELFIEIENKVDDGAPRLILRSNSNSLYITLREVGEDGRVIGVYDARELIDAFKLISKNLKYTC